MFLDFFLPFYDDFLDKVPSKIRKILGLILFSIGTVLIISMNIPYLLVGIILTLVGVVTFFHNSLNSVPLWDEESNENGIEKTSEVNKPTAQNSALPWLIGSVSTLAFILVASVILLWLRSVADEILIGGPPPT